MAIVAWIVGKDAQYAVIQFQPVTYDGIVDLMTPIVLVAIFMERALEVFVATGRKLGRGEKERALQKARNKLDQLDERLKAFQAQLDAPGAAQLSAAAKKEIHDRMQNVANLVPTEQREERHADSALEAYRVVTSRISFVVGSLFGLIIGLAGLRAVPPWSTWTRSSGPTSRNSSFTASTWSSPPGCWPVGPRAFTRWSGYSATSPTRRAARPRHSRRHGRQRGLPAASPNCRLPPHDRAL